MELTSSSMDDHKAEQLDESNQKLRESLKACRELVAEYRSKLAANGNDPLLPYESGQDSDEARS